MTISQPHLLFYASRTLPNSLALPLVLWCLGSYPLDVHPGAFIQLAAFVILVIRCELALLLGSFLLLGLLSREISLAKLVTCGAAASAISLIVTVPFDSYFWGEFVWPEGKVFYFNAVEGKSSQWGVSPFWWYFKSALPRACLTSLVFIPLGFLNRRLESSRLLFPALFFVLLYSFNPHKELRFIIYVVPILNVVSAFGFDFIFERRSQSFFWKTVWFGCLASLALNLFATLVFVSVSALNYPGGIALEKLHHHVPCHVPVSLHISNLAAQTGVTRFGQECDRWIYDKSENLTPQQLLDKNYTHLIAENNQDTILASEKYRMISTVAQYSHIKIEPLPPSIQFKEALVILERRDFADIVPKDAVYENNWIRTSEDL